MWLFLHRPFEIWPWMGTLRIERVSMIFILITWLTVSEKQLTENKINFAVFLFVLSMTVATLLSPYTTIFDSGGYQNWMKYLVFYFLVMTSVKKEKDLKIIVTAFVVCFFIYMLHSYREYLCGRFTYVMGTKRLIGVDSTMSDPNGFGGSMVICLPFLLPLSTLFKKKWHYFFMVGYTLLSVRCIQLTGSRSAFLGLGVLLFSAAATSKHRMKLVPIMCILSVVIWFTLTDNLRDRYRTIVDSSINESANQSAQGRLHGFYMGWKNWEKSPIWGVGPDCHGYATGEGYLSHCLYGQIPGELGILGITAMTLLLFCFLLNHFQISQDYKYLQQKGMGKMEGLFCLRISTAIMFSIFLLLL
ncbi:MAG: O-antigen ligase family protein, partial [Planctomycetaceae bacterium]|nr:O-antigen ligase family protein [Planctomycetaceae bacterium]